MAADEARSIPVHRCRFVDTHPASITAIAFPPRALPRPSHSRRLRKDKGKQPLPGLADDATDDDDDEQEREISPGVMAVGRANGNIELYDWAGEGCAQAWVLLATLYGPAGSRVTNLVFTLRHPHTLSPWSTAPLPALRLFSTSSSSELFEWSLASLSISATLPSGGGSIWSLAGNGAGTRLAMGCEDGGVRIVDLREGRLEVERRCERVKPRLLSLAWGPPVLKARPAKAPAAAGGDSDEEDDDEDTEDAWADTYLVAGCSDSTLRTFSCTTGRPLARLTLDKLRTESTLAWAVGVTPDGTVVSGDSLGNVGFWDLATGTRVAGFRSHAADVLALAIGPNGKTVYTTGVDQKISEHTLIALPNQAARWVQTTSRRLHAHDVRALAVFPPCSPLPSLAVSRTCPVLVSGGQDLSPVLAPCAPPQKADAHGAGRVGNVLMTSKAAGWADGWHRRVPYVRRGEVVLGRKRGWVVCKREQGVGVWFLRHPAASLEGLSAEGGEGGAADEGGWGKALEMELTGSGNLACLALGEPEDVQEPAWLAVSDGAEVKLWRLSGEKDDITPKRIKGFSARVMAQLPASTGLLGASALAFTPGASHLLIATTPSCTPASTILVIDLSDLSLAGSLVPPAPTSASASASAAASWISELAVSPDGQYVAALPLHAPIQVYSLRTLKPYCALPALPSHAVALHFLPSRLVVALANNGVQCYSLRYRRLDDATKVFCAALSARLGTMHDAVLGLTSRARPEGEGEVFIYGSSWVCRADLLGSATAPATDGPGAEGAARKRKRHAAAEAYKLPAPPGMDEARVRIETRYKFVCLVDFARAPAPASGDAMDVDAERPGPEGKAREEHGRETIVLVERPVADVLAEGPAAWNHNKFGT
ncbi:WD40 repeat-like protein [Calocera cornea HHB12733]|uniref:WD40 repeat-like protein n=1 Tax=Calocera cornea HHB12733 TaxID=1353952 RepID=A0A165DZP2_9BASI|nr:WD40 repeat-like protein [Calocera cornea HHB12733]